MCEQRFWNSRACHTASFPADHNSAKLLVRTQMCTALNIPLAIHRTMPANPRNSWIAKCIHTAHHCPSIPESVVRGRLYEGITALGPSGYKNVTVENILSCSHIQPDGPTEKMLTDIQSGGEEP